MLDSIDLNESQKRMLRMGVFAIFAFTMLGGGIYMQGHAFGLLGMRSSSGTPASPPASDQQKAPSSDSKLPDPSSTGDPAADTKTPSASEKQKKTKKERGSQPESNTMEQQMRPGDNLAEQGSDSRTQSESTERPSAETKESEPKRSSAETPELPERSQSEGEGAEDNSPLVYNPFTGETHEVMQLRHRLKKQELQLQK